MGCAAAVSAVLLMGNGALQITSTPKKSEGLEEFVKAKLLLILLKVERLGLTLLFLHALYSAQFGIPICWKLLYHFQHLGKVLVTTTESLILPAKNLVPKAIETPTV